MRLSPEDPLRTFSEDEKLPPLPLPSLKHTLERYVDSVRPFVSDAEFAKTQEIVKNFENGEGKVLQEKLEAKAKIEKNWVSSQSCFINSWNDIKLVNNPHKIITKCQSTISSVACISSQF